MVHILFQGISTPNPVKYVTDTVTTTLRLTSGGPDIEYAAAAPDGSALLIYATQADRSSRHAVAIASGCCHAYAFPMRREHGTWKAELTSGRLQIGILGPKPGSAGQVQQIAFEAQGTRGGATAVLYADGVTLFSKEYPGRKSSTVFANLDSPLARGHHNAVAFAARGNSAAAAAWTFVAR